MEKAKVVYNACFGGFTLSREAVILGRQISGNPKWGGACIVGDTYSGGERVDSDYDSSADGISRHDRVLVEVVEALGDRASGFCSDLQIAEVNSVYRIDEYDGNETVEEPNDLEWINPFKQ